MSVCGQAYICSRLSDAISRIVGQKIVMFTRGIFDCAPNMRNNHKLASVSRLTESFLSIWAMSIRC